ncbi:MAG TPA: DUF3768 domain-containing protein [Candidatus Paceibacterota bacterium]|nr:DUF3768 domain-containing protein [Candidatus Paceibacterota bacterium]
MPFHNYYRCARCNHHWSDVWTTQGDDDCPACGARHMSPYKSEDVVDTGRAKKIAELNDAFRNTLSGGEIFVTPGVHDLPPMVVAAAIQQMAEFNNFTPDNDPYGEHDFGSFDLCNRKFYFKIDYYGKTCDVGSEDPADPAKTNRVLTLMLASEY